MITFDASYRRRWWRETPCPECRHTIVSAALSTGGYLYCETCGHVFPEPESVPRDAAATRERRAS